MGNVIHKLDISLAIMYLCLFGIYAKSFFDSEKKPWRFLPVFLPAVLVFHLIKLGIQGFLVGHCPIVEFGETFSFTAFCLGAIYLIARRKLVYCAEGAVFVGLICLFQFIAVFAATNNDVIYEQLKNIPFGFHAPIALIGMALFAASAIYGILYIAMFWMLKSKKLVSLLGKLPPLERVESMIGFSMTVGVIFFGLAIISGFVMAKMYDLPIFTDPKIIISLAVFAIFAYGAVGSKFCAFSGYCKSAVAILGFALGLMSMTIVRFYLTKLHGF